MASTVILSAKERQLIEAIDEVGSEVEKDVLLAKLAIYRARFGEYKSSESIIADIKLNNARAPNLVRSAWIHLANGIRLYFEEFGTSTSDGVQRAYAIAEASGLRDIQALCAAWLAQWSYSELNMLALSSYLRISFSLSDKDDHAVLARANLVGAQALHYGGRPDLAKSWYKRATYHASSDLDDLSISAVLHNRTWLQMLNLRQVVLTQVGSCDVGRHLSMSADSNLRFDDARNDKSWKNLKDILRAQILSLEGDFKEAITLYGFAIGLDKSTSRVEANVLADFGRCYAEMGDFPNAVEYIERALKALKTSTNIDDRAATHTLASMVFRMAGRTVDEQLHRELAASSWAAHSVNQESAISFVQATSDLAR